MAASIGDHSHALHPLPLRARHHLFFAAVLNAQIPAAAPDANLYTSYFFGTGYQSVTWIVCGSTAETEGCYDSGSLGTFGNAGALIEGNPSVNTATSTVTRVIYVIDTAASGGTGVTLSAYKKTDVVTSTFDTTTVTLIKTISLSLTGGAGALAYMAANNGYLFVGTNLSTSAVRVQKGTLATESLACCSPPINVSSITTDRYGFVTVTFGDSIEFGGDNGFLQFDPDGNSVDDGGGAWFMLTTDQALTTANLPTSSALPKEKLEVHRKNRSTMQKKDGAEEISLPSPR